MAETKTVWVVRWYNQGEWYEAICATWLGDLHLVRSATSEPSDTLSPEVKLTAA